MPDCFIKFVKKLLLCMDFKTVFDSALIYITIILSSQPCSASLLVSFSVESVYEGKWNKNHTLGGWHKFISLQFGNLVDKWRCEGVCVVLYVCCVMSWWIELLPSIPNGCAFQSQMFNLRSRSLPANASEKQQRMNQVCEPLPSTWWFRSCSSFLSAGLGIT